MRKIQLFVLSVVVVLFTACHDKLWDSIEDLDSRVTKLEELCKEMNTNISALQTIVSVIQENDFITGIVPIEKGGEVIGYTIMFGKHEPITIYNGEDGKDGQNGIDGKDGYTPILGVAKDVDGVYYWTLDGEWLLDAEGNKIRVTGRDGKDGVDGEDGKDGADGKDGQDGQDGKDGTNGTNGADGKDGVTPQLKIENGYWYISYDNGATWTELGKAVGEDGKDGTNGTDGKDGQDGEKGDKGDSMFTSVTYDENNVYFTLTDGSVLIVPRGNSGGAGENDPSDIIEFKDLNVKSALLQMDIDTNGDGEISYGEAANYTGSLEIKSNTNILSFKECQYFTGVTSVSFNGCTNLFEIVLPNTLNVIKDNAFSGNNKLTILRIPENCTTIGKSAFRGCSLLREITLPTKLKRIEEYTFYGCTSLASLEIPNSVNYIGNNALYNLTVDTLTLPEQYSADPIFDLNNSKLTTIVWNSISYPTDYIKSSNGLGTSYYGIGAYWVTISISGTGTKTTEGIYNTTISTIIFGEKVEFLPRNLCYKMSSLKTIYSKNTIPPIIDNYTFNNCKNIENVYVPKESVDAYKTQWSQFADKIVGYDF